MKRTISGFCKVILSSIIFLMAVLTCFNTQEFTSNAANNIVIVIDPGHGGTGDRNLGAQYNGFSEKELTLQVANAMKAELEKYEGVTVYLTRTTDVYMSLDDRAAFAQSVGANFVYSIHFNASSEHEFYGSEIWTSAFGSYYQKGYDFGQIESTELGALGLYQKGVKTRLGSSGKDYYGIIRSCVARSIPCVIIEHAYIDHGYDVPLLRSADFINKLAVADATSVAKYYNLKSSTNDFAGFKYSKVAKPSRAVPDDTTDPEVCDIKILGTDKASGNVLVEMTVKDSQSPIIYFAYSYDGGKTYSYLQMWDRTKATQSFNVKVPAGYSNPVIKCKCYNSYEKFKESQELTVTF
ncbi:N-acetylmuramoyl-L-alanine amidase family protein [Butyrivibrio proteoclasticus]|uniref:N-acetylmuramoyl-L-alanine amidase family protein n=1 Tax=Butyrivibrio proteoclasticus TaxID=43305 RepID=UPI00047AA69F|nr:N-acetylmuramoyl-L-alanine amidase [Butyrivibrio proteoclasticus]